MKKVFVSPEADVIILASTDILTSSTQPPIADNENDAEWD